MTPEVNRFFVDKVEKVRSNASGASPPTFSRVRPGVSRGFLAIDDRRRHHSCSPPTRQVVGRRPYTDERPEAGH